MKRVAALALATMLAGCTCSRGGHSAETDGAAATPANACACPPPPPAPRFDPARTPEALAPSDRALVVQVDAEPPTLMPMIRPEWTSWLVVAHLVDESLVRLDRAKGTLVPELAESWDVDESRTKWTFHLRKDVKWHDGAAFDADDVVFTFERLLDPSTGASDRALLVGAKVTKLSAHDVELKLAAPLATPGNELDRLLILPRHRSPRGDLARSPDATAPVGTGPMRLVSWTRGSEIVLERNASYWGAPAPVSKMSFRFVAAPGTALAALERGEVDVVPRASPDLVEKLEASAELKAKYDVVRAAGPNFTAWIHNVRSPKLADPRVRRAVGLAVPRRVLACDVERCNVTIAMGPLPGTHAALAGFGPPPFSPKEAAAALDSAQIVDRDGDGKRDFEGKPFTLRFFYPATSREQARIASVVAEELRRIGVTLEMVPLEWGQMLRQLELHEFELAAIEWTIDDQPDLFPLFHSTQVAGSLNYGGYADPDVDAWLEELRKEVPDARRTELLHSVVDRVRRDEPTTFLFSPLTLAIVRKGAKGVTPTPLGWEPRAWGW